MLWSPNCVRKKARAIVIWSGEKHADLSVLITHFCNLHCNVFFITYLYYMRRSVIRLKFLFITKYTSDKYHLSVNKTTFFYGGIQWLIVSTSRNLRWSRLLFCCICHVARIFVFCAKFCTHTVAFCTVLCDPTATVITSAITKHSDILINNFRQWHNYFLAAILIHVW